MQKGQITCSACSHEFAVPANARAAICPRCGQALPVFDGSIEPTSVHPPRPRSEELSAKLARIQLKKTAPPIPPPPPIPAPGQTHPTFSTIPNADAVQTDLPPLPDWQDAADDEGTRQSARLSLGADPDVQFIPIETEAYDPEEHKTESYDALNLDGETEQMDHLPWDDPSGAMTSPDLPRRIPGPPIDMDYFEEPLGPDDPAFPMEADYRDLPTVTGQEEHLYPFQSDPAGTGAFVSTGDPPTMPWGNEDMLPTQQHDDPMSRVPTQPEAAPIQPRSSLPPLPPVLPPLPSAPPASSLPPLPSAHPASSLPPLPSAHPASSLPPLPPVLPPLPSAPPASSLAPLPSTPPASSLPPLPPPPASGLPPGPLIPTPPMVLPDTSSSQRVRALDRAISEVIEPGAGPPVEDDDDDADEPTTARVLEDEPEVAPLSLHDSGIMVAIPQSPIEEVQKGLARPQPVRPMDAVVDATAELLAPISRMPRRSAAGHGVALREVERVKRKINWKPVLVVGGVVILAVVVTIVVLNLVAR